MNAVTHGLLAKRLLLNDEQAEEFAMLHTNLLLEYQPDTETQRILVDEFATLCWKLRAAQTLEMHQLKNRQRSAEIVFQTLAAECEVDELSKLTRADDLASGARVGWECTELSITSSNRTLAEEGSKGGYKHTGVNDPLTNLSQSLNCKNHRKHGNILVQAKVNTGIETIVRYEKSFRNDFYKAMDVLRRLKGKKGVIAAATPASSGETE